MCGPFPNALPTPPSHLTLPPLPPPSSHQQPLYMVVREQLSLATTALFHQKDFTERSLLQALYHSLSRSVASSAASADDAYLHSGLNLRRLVNRLRHKILQVYKLLFLERRCAVTLDPRHLVLPHRSLTPAAPPPPRPEW